MHINQSVINTLRFQPVLSRKQPVLARRCPCLFEKTMPSPTSFNTVDSPGLFGGLGADQCEGRGARAR